jgi:hypothetical protein
VGYNDSSKAYRIYILEQHKIEVSRDATLLHLKITHFDSVASVVITSVISVAY